MTGVASIATLLGAGSASAENVIYKYDALGRLIAVTTTGGPNDQTAMRVTFDAAGNRANYSVATAAVPDPPVDPTPTPTPTPSPTGGSSPSLFIVVPLAGMMLVPIR